MRDLKEMSDIELVRKIKSFRTDCPSKGIYLGALYDRYLPMISKHSAKVFRTGKANKHMYQDFLQDAYFAVIRAVDGVSYDKFPCKVEEVDSNWKFSNVLWYYLKKLEKAYYKYLISQNNLTPYDKEMYSEEGHSEVESKCVEWNYYIPYTSQNQDLLQEFMNSLSTRERDIIDMKIQGLTHKEIARRLDSSLSLISYYVGRSRRKAESIFDVTIPV